MVNNVDPYQTLPHIYIYVCVCVCVCLHSSAFILLYVFVVSNTKELFLQLYLFYDFVNKTDLMLNTINHIDLCRFMLPFLPVTASRYG